MLENRNYLITESNLGKKLKIDMKVLRTDIFYTKDELIWVNSSFFSTLPFEIKRIPPPSPVFYRW